MRNNPFRSKGLLNMEKMICCINRFLYYVYMIMMTSLARCSIDFARGVIREYVDGKDGIKRHFSNDER